MATLDNRSRNRLLMVLFVGVLMGALDIAIVGPALPAIRTSFGMDDRGSAWVFNIYLLGNLVGTPLMAKLSDRMGRRSIYILDVLLFAAGSLIVALSPSFQVLLLGRAVQGLGAGGIFPVASAVIGDTFPVEKRGSALGLIGAVFGIAFLVGPIIGGIILGVLNWHWLFLINLPIAAALTLAALRLLPATRADKPKPFDWLGTAVLTAMLSALSYGMSRLDTANIAVSLRTPHVLYFLLLALILLPVFVWIERRAVDPVLHLGLFSGRQMVLVNLFAALSGLAEAVLVFVPSMAVLAFGVSEATASYMLLPLVLVMAIGSPLAGRMLDRVGSRSVVLLGTSALAVGMALIGLITPSLAVFYVAGALVGIGLSWLLGAPLRYIMLNEAPRAQRAPAQAALALSTRVGQLLGAALVGAVSASIGGVLGYQRAFLLIAAISLVYVVIGLLLKTRSVELATMQRNETHGAAMR